MEHLRDVGGCREYFSAVIAGYISAVYQHLQHVEQPRTPVRHRRLGSQSQVISEPLGIGRFATTAEYAKQLINGEMAQKLYKITQTIHEKALKQAKILIKERNEDQFPWVEGSRMDIDKVSLEFVKTVCKVLSLDSSVQDDVTKVRRNMLRLISVGDFSDEAVWHDPCVSFVLPEVICKACNHCRDIDLCKDNYRTAENDSPVWQCPLCQTSYDNSEIEYLLLDIMHRKAMAYTLQDLQCKKCLQIKLENMTQFCSCAGDFQTLISRKDLAVYLKTFRGIAQHFKMPLLLETVEFNIQMNPSLIT